MAKKKAKKKATGKPKGKKKDLLKKKDKSKKLKQKERKEKERKKKALKKKAIKKKDSKKKGPSKKKKQEKSLKKLRKSGSMPDMPQQASAEIKPESTKFTDHSSNYNARDALGKLRSLKDPGEVNAFVKGEKRVTVTKAVPALLRKLGA